MGDPFDSRNPIRPRYCWTGELAASTGIMTLGNVRLNLKQDRLPKTTDSYMYESHKEAGTINAALSSCWLTHGSGTH